jgi:hypothetical protein
MVDAYGVAISDIVARLSDTKRWRPHHLVEKEKEIAIFLLACRRKRRVPKGFRFD